MAVTSPPIEHVVFQTTKGACSLSPARLRLGGLGQPSLIEMGQPGTPTNLLGPPPGRTSSWVRAEVALTNNVVQIRFELEDGVRIVMQADADANIDTLKGTWHTARKTCEGTWVAR
jgi:hypothetical protein